MGRAGRGGVRCNYGAAFFLFFFFMESLVVWPWGRLGWVWVGSDRVWVFSSAELV